MKKITDYKDEAAIDLWMDIIEAGASIVEDEEIKKLARDENSSNVQLAKQMIKRHKKEVCSILLLIDETPIDGMNILIRLIDLITEIGKHPEIADFFGVQGQSETGESSGSATENTEAKEH